MGILPVCMYVRTYVQHACLVPVAAKEGTEFPGTGVTDGFESSCEC